jgi:hypothetical protein
MRRHTFGLFTLLGFVLLFTCARTSSATYWVVSPGVKVGWIFGKGLTYGVEVSTIRMDIDPNNYTVDGPTFLKLVTQTYGIVLNFDTDFSTQTRLRLGAEWVGPLIGIETGPALMFDGQGSHWGWGTTPWIGYDLFTYYTHTSFFDQTKSQEELGLYLKVPLLDYNFDEVHDSGYHHHDDWD